MFEYVPLELASGWPVNVTYAEAAAYARWREARLPSEPELLRAAYGSRDGEDDGRPYPWGHEPLTSKHANVGFVEGAPTPVGSHPAGASGFGVHDLIGDGWEWTSTPFLAHEGFTSWIRGYQGYSSDFFDGQHNVLLGGSWATPAKLVRRSFRNWFRTTYPYPFTKFRLVRDD
jgi:formylglycine-generating enzyme required for sulfatase activity